MIIIIIIFIPLFFFRLAKHHHHHHLLFSGPRCVVVTLHFLSLCFSFPLGHWHYQSFFFSHTSLSISLCWWCLSVRLSVGYPFGRKKRWDLKCLLSVCVWVCVIHLAGAHLAKLHQGWWWWSTVEFTFFVDIFTTSFRPCKFIFLSSAWHRSLNEFWVCVWSILFFPMTERPKGLRQLWGLNSWRRRTFVTPNQLL